MVLLFSFTLFQHLITDNKKNIQLTLLIYVLLYEMIRNTIKNEQNLTKKRLLVDSKVQNVLEILNNNHFSVGFKLTYYITLSSYIGYHLSLY